MLNDEIIERVVAYFPNAKVIFLAGDPVERAWSQLSMGVRLRMISSFDATDVDEVLRNLLHPGVLLARIQARSSHGGNAMFIRIGSMSISLMIYREIPLNCVA